MNKVACIWVALLVTLMVEACSWPRPDLAGSNMPQSIAASKGAPVVRDSPNSQALLSSARHWQLVASDVAHSFCMTASLGECDRTTSSRPCVKMSFESHRLYDRPVFPAVFRDALQSELMAEGARVFAPYAVSDCDRIEIRATVVNLTRDRHTPYYVGDYAALAQGVVAVRNIARAASGTFAIAPTILGAEIAYWLSPNYMTRHPMAEVSISVMRVSQEGEYRSDYTNVYYIDARDAGAYVESEQKELLGNAVDVTREPPPIPSEMPLPLLLASDKSVAKGNFSGRSPFRIAGSTAAFLIGASADGSEVVGNTQFHDGHWHVAIMRAGGGGAQDLGTMGGIQACATGISSNGNVVVGLVQVSSPATPANDKVVAAEKATRKETGCAHKDTDPWSVFKLTLADKGSNTVQILGTGSYATGSVESVLVSADGSTVVATVMTVGDDKQSQEHVVRWQTSSSVDTLLAALKQPPIAKDDSCAVDGVSSDGKTVVFSCRSRVPATGSFTRHHYIYPDPSPNGGPGRKEDAPSPPGVVEFSPALDQVEAMSGDLSVAIGSIRDSGGQVIQAIARPATAGGGGASRMPTGFLPTGLSADGKVVFGHVSPSNNAAVWYAANGSIEPPVPVFEPNSIATDDGLVQGKCVFAIGAYSNGSLILVNEVTDSNNCKPGNGTAAWVVGP